MSVKKERERIKQIIIGRLRKGPTYRKDLHLECCRQLGKSASSSLKPSRMCEDMPDSQFDFPLKELEELEVIRKIGNLKQKGNFMFYELMESKKE